MYAPFGICQSCGRPRRTDWDDEPICTNEACDLFWAADMVSPRGDDEVVSICDTNPEAAIEKAIYYLNSIGGS